MLNDKGDTLEGIIGANGEVLGADLISLSAGCAFPEHRHPSDHVVYVVKGSGALLVEGVPHPLAVDDTAYVSAQWAHGLSAEGSTSGLTVVVVSIPHKGVSHVERMQTV